jgi:hypothetical protein
MAGSHTPPLPHHIAPSFRCRPPLPPPTTETNNEVNREMAAQGEAEQYMNINVMQPIVCPSLETLKMLDTLNCEFMHLSGSTVLCTCTPSSPTVSVSWLMFLHTVGSMHTPLRCAAAAARHSGPAQHIK